MISKNSFNNKYTGRYWLINFNKENHNSLLWDSPVVMLGAHKITGNENIIKEKCKLTRDEIE